MDSTRLFEILDTQGRKQRWLAAQIGCSEQLVCDIKAGRRKPTVAFMERAAEVLGLPLDVLIMPSTLHAGSETLPTETEVAA